MTTKRTTKKAPAKAGAVERQGNFPMPPADPEESDWNDSSNDYWRELIQLGMTDEDWDRAVMAVRCFKYEYPRMLWDKARQRENYTFDDHSRLATMAADFLRMFMAAQDISSTSRKRQAASAAAARWATDPKRAAMNDVKKKWEAMKSGAAPHRSDAQFARDMMRDYGDVLSEGGIKNAISRWRKKS